MIKDSAKKFFAKELPKEKIRELQEKGVEIEPGFWKKLVKLGWLGLVFPEEYKGEGFGFLELAALYEECGRALMPTPFYSTMAAALCIMNGGRDEQKKELLPAISQGKIKVSMAVTESQAINNLSYLKTNAQIIDGKYYLSGKKLFVPNTQSADYLIVAAQTHDVDFNYALTLFLVDKSSKGLTFEALKPFGLDSQSEVGLDKVEVSADQIIGKIGDGESIIRQTTEQTTALQCVEMVGGAQEVIKMTADYVKKRVQFDRPIGSFQAVQHHMANMTMDIEGAYYAAWNAVWRLSEGKSCAKEISLAKAWVNKAYKFTTTMAHQLHGGIGYATEYDLHLYSNRALTTSIWHGTSAYHYQRLADQLGM
jgi:alkylation response protein AidB-like acyl-CoA dehydrogenase